MERSKVAWVAMVVLLFAGCGEPTLKSDDFDGSAERLRESVSEEQRPALRDALALVRRARSGRCACR